MHILSCHLPFDLHFPHPKFLSTWNLATFKGCCIIHYRITEIVNVGLPGNTLTEYTAKITGHYQNGFRTNWGIIDNLCILRQVIQKECEYMCFKQVLDSIHRHKTIKIINIEQYPVKLQD